MQWRSPQSGRPSRTPPPTGLADSNWPALGPDFDQDDVSLLGDTIHFPGKDASDEKPVVRPALAMLYRLAVGPNADHYAPRFLAYERARRLRPGWHWPAFLVPPVWAAYRRLFSAAFAFGVLPLLGAMGFVALGTLLENSPDVVWWAWALLLVWVVPGAIAAFFANPLLFRRVRTFAQAAEQETLTAAQAASRIVSEPPVSRTGTLVAVAGMLLVYGAVSMDVRDAWNEQVVRQQVASSIDAVRLLQQQVEDTWATSRLVRKQTGAVLGTPAVRGVVEDVDVSPSNGRLRLAFGANVPELAGKAILLAPAIDAGDHVRWICVPVDIPARYLPRECVTR
jgi:hypothetical protein